MTRNGFDTKILISQGQLTRMLLTAARP